MAKQKKPVDVNKYYDPDIKVVENPGRAQRFKEAFEREKRAREEIGPKASPEQTDICPITHPPEPTPLEKVFRQLNRGVKRDE